MSIKTRIVGVAAMATLVASLGLVSAPAGADPDDIVVCTVNCGPDDPDPVDPVGPGDFENCTQDCGGGDDDGGGEGGEPGDDGDVDVDEADPAQPRLADPTFTG